MSAAPALGLRSAVCALIPHYESHDWLGAAIESLLDQTRPPEAIVVIDDASSTPPVDVVARHPSVTLLGAPENVGPYRLIQTVIDSTGFDAYLFQDADDISHPGRLQCLLEHAAESGAAMVGSYEVRIDTVANQAAPVDYPLDVNRALEESPIAFALLHPTSLVARSLVTRVGGYPGGLRFGGDVDFLWRAAHVGRVVNVAEHLYVRRVGHDSLSGSARTGLRSSARRHLDGELRAVARQNAAAKKRDAPLRLQPFSPAPPVELRRLAGPEPAAIGRVPASARSLPLAAGQQCGPVVIIGAPRSGADLLKWSLDHHPAFRTVPDGRWLGELAAAIAPAEGSSETFPDPGLTQVRAAVRTALEGGPARLVFAGTELTAAALEIFALEPEARFIHIARDPEASVASLRAFPGASDDFYAGEGATAACRELNVIGGMVEIALPASSVLRLEFDRLIDQPDDVLRACLEFLGEPWMPACARPLAMCRAGSPVAAPSPTPRRAPVALPPTDLAAHLESWRRRQLPGAASLPDRLRRLVAQAVSPEAIVSVVSKGDPALLTLDTKSAWHFPETPDGGYAGEYPATSEGAVELLESVRRRGATHFVVPAPGLWWLSFYDGLATHLQDHYDVVAFEQSTGIVFTLQPLDQLAGQPVTRAAVRTARRSGTSGRPSEVIAS